jgi:hypothetical protein
VTTWMRQAVRRSPRLWAFGRRMRSFWWQLTDPRRSAEEAGARVVYEHLARTGFLNEFRGHRILEVGPKHGKDSLLLAGLAPSELVLLDLPSKRRLIQTWLPAVEAAAPTRYVEGNLLYMPRDVVEALGSFELVWCAGGVYHNVEQLRLLRRLFNLSSTNGALVVESATARSRRLADENLVEVRWPPNPAPTITHLPTRRALATWLGMVGFVDVQLCDVYSRALRWQRAVLTARHPETPRPYLSYEEDAHASYVAGEAT